MKQQLSNLAQPRKLAFQHRRNNGKVITTTHCKDNANNPVERLPSTHYHLITALGSVSGEEIMQWGEWTMNTEKEAAEGGSQSFPWTQFSSVQHCLAQHCATKITCSSNNCMLYTILLLPKTMLVLQSWKNMHSSKGGRGFDTEISLI